MLRRAFLSVGIFMFVFMTIFSFLFYNLTQVRAYNESMGIDVQDSIHRNLENIALDELTLGMDEDLRKQNVAIIKNVNQVKHRIQERFNEFINANPDYSITKYRVVSPDAKIKGSYNTASDKLYQTAKQLPEISIDVEGKYVNTIADFGKLQYTPFSFIVTIKTDFLTVEQRQSNTTNKKGMSDKGDGYSFKAYKETDSYAQLGNSFMSDGIGGY